MRTIVFLLLVFTLAYAGYGKSFESFFWKDDWAWLYSANYNPLDFFHSTVGETWLVRTGLFMYPYVLYLHRIIRDSQTWQLIGFALKVINSLLFYFFIQSLTQKKSSALVGSLLYACYSGGLESYTWHRLNALATSFILLGFTFYSNFLNTQKLKQFIGSYLCFILALFSYMGRSAGIAGVCVVWGLIACKKNILLFLLLIIAPYLLLVKWVSTQQSLPPGYFQTALQNHWLYFGIIGNLLKNPFLKTQELGYLANLDSVSYILGYVFLLVGVMFGFFYLRQPTAFRKLGLFLICWVFLLYLPNWIYGGGGITTLISSGHRYLAVSGLGVVALWVILLQKLPRLTAAFTSTLLILANLSYSRHLTDLESSVRNRHLVEPIYNQLYSDMKQDKDVQLIVVDTPNDLASFVVGGWYPYTFAYYTGLKDITKFPVVVSRTDLALRWACAPTQEEKHRLAALGGFADNQNLSTLTPGHIYAWSLSKDGELVNRTEVFRSAFVTCTLQAKKM